MYSLGDSDFSRSGRGVEHSSSATTPKVSQGKLKPQMVKVQETKKTTDSDEGRAMSRRA